MTNSDSTLGAAIHCAATALGSSSSKPLGATRPPLDSKEAARAIIMHRLSRLAVDNADQIGLRGESLEQVTNDALAHTHAAFQLIAQTSEVVSLVESAGIRFLVIKGVALAALTSTVGFRGAGDVDILVDPQDVPRLHRVLVDSGYRPHLALPDPRRWQGRLWRWLDREATYLGHGATVDVHWRISSQHHLFTPFETLYSRRTSVEIAGIGVPTMSRPDTLAAACYHSYFDQFQPARSLVDVVLALQALDDSPWPGLPQQLQRLIAGVIDLVREVFPGVVDEEAARLLATLPQPPAIVRKQFDRALSAPRKRWEESKDKAALWQKFVAEAAFESALTAGLRFVGKRLFDLPVWTSARQTSTLREGLAGRYLTERRRKLEISRAR